MKAATELCERAEETYKISIHAAREGGDAAGYAVTGFNRISIHAAREGGDGINSGSPFADCSFQSTPPVKAATAGALMTVVQRGISIHAAREGGDAACKQFTAT